MNRLINRSRILAVVMLVAAGGAAAEEPRYGVCRQEMADYVRNQLGQTVERIQINAYQEISLGVDSGEALVFVKECNGYHAFDIFGTKSVCEHLPHYGSGASYIYYTGAYGGCKAKR